MGRVCEHMLGGVIMHTHSADMVICHLPSHWSCNEYDFIMLMEHTYI